MSKDVFSKLANEMAYGTISRGQIPGDIEDYNVTLVKQYRNNLPYMLRLKFESKINNNLDNFQIRIDQIREPANPMILINYQENEGKVKASAKKKIKNKMILSVEKNDRQREQIIESDEQSGDSDIPKGKPLHERLKQTLGSQTENKSRKKQKNNQQSGGQDEYQS